MESTKTFSERSRRALKRLYKKPGALILTAVIVVIGGALALFLLPKGERINTDGYQVVYMATGQNFFGKLQNTSGEYLVLKSPYTAQDVEAGKEQAQTTLLKVSQQAYGPEDTLSLKSDQVLFWQNLRNDSKVVQAIRNQQ
ncbi:MAG TPA: hypothetical protein PK096_01900 [Candidatus Saccharibacteria bacterium]|nr:hypothetical protein [Candidatus Saccharibacteria bacterium]HRK94100.1 hypothetical protein [Candidatus Saccharibacteria bacterium]